MKPATPKTTVIIGAGIALLSMGVYTRRNSYSSQIFEMDKKPGGVMTACEVMKRICNRDGRVFTTSRK